MTPLPLAVANDASRCGPGTVTLTASGAPAGGSYAWYTAATGGTPVATTASYTTPSLAATTTYYVSALSSPASGGCEGPRDAVAAIINAVPAAPTTTNASRCGPGTVTLTASGAPAGGSYAWYTAATGGTPVATTASYTTPSLAATTTYYVETVSSLNQLTIGSLGTTNSFSVEHNTVSGDDRGGIAVTPSYLYYTGDSFTARFDAGTLANPVSLPMREALFSDLSSGALWTLMTGVGTIAPYGGGTITHVNTLNADLTLGATSLPLSTPINVTLVPHFTPEEVSSFCSLVAPTLSTVST